MYIPKINLLNDRDEIVAFMKLFSFATIVTAKDNLPIGTHLPFLVSIRNDKVVLTSHFAKSNEHWKYIETNKNLIIFNEPHAYISPINYDTKLNVPTWNYISVHAYGGGKLITETNNVFRVLESTIDNYEVSYKQQWNNLPEEYKLKMSKGIVAFEVVISDLQAKKKLSQNRSESEQNKIIDNLSKSSNCNEQLIADYMRKTINL
jgi:transcriptional regulator